MGKFNLSDDHSAAIGLKQVVAQIVVRVHIIPEHAERVLLSSAKHSRAIPQALDRRTRKVEHGA